MKQISEDKHIEIKISAIIFSATILLTVPFRWVLAVILSALVHEMAHVIAIWLCGGQISLLKIGAMGAEIQTNSLTGWKEFLCLLAGPIGSIMLLLAFRWLPLTAIFGCIQGLFNLLPIFPLDGWRILRCVLRKFFCEKTMGIILKRVELCAYVCLLLLSAVGILVFNLGTWPLGIFSFFLIPKISRKIPCKLLLLGLQ